MKRTRQKRAYPLSPIALVATALAVAALSAACDEFSFVSLLSLPDQTELTLTVAQESVTSGSSVALEVGGGTPPYTFSPLSGSDLYQPTSNRSLGTIADSVFTAGQAIGKVLITVEDAAGGSAFVEVSVIPPKPVFDITQSGISGSNPTKSNFKVTWDYIDSLMVDGFNIDVSIDGSEYSYLATAVSTDRSIQAQNNISFYTSVSYRIVAKADGFVSIPEIKTFLATP